MSSEAFDLCKQINGRCGCEETGARGCETIFELIENGENEDDERDRMEQAREDAAYDAE
jgi:hypothetical protein